VSTVRHHLDIERRCTDAADPRRIVVLRVEYGDAV